MPGENVSPYEQGDETGFSDGYVGREASFITSCPEYRAGYEAGYREGQAHYRRQSFLRSVERTRLTQVKPQV